LKRRLPDTRLNWRDPDMPVLRLNNKREMIEVSPEYIHSYYDRKMASLDNIAPSWRHDPTYDLRKK
jgi:hypothetical protein